MKVNPVFFCTIAAMFGWLRERHTLTCCNVWVDMRESNPQLFFNAMKPFTFFLMLFKLENPSLHKYEVWNCCNTFAGYSSSQKPKIRLVAAAHVSSYVHTRLQGMLFFLFTKFKIKRIGQVH